MKRFRIVNLLLLLLLGLATWRIVGVWRRNVPTPPPSEAEAPRPREPMIALARRPPDPSLATRIAEKDLFDPSRQPPSAASGPTPEQTPAPPPPTLKLAGVIVVGEAREAVLSDTTKNQQLRRREGEEISGYRVSKITADNVSLVSPTGEEVQLALLIDTTRKAPAAGGQAFGPGGRPTPVPRNPQAQAAARAAQVAQPEPAQMYPGAFGPRGIDRGEVERQREDARQRAQRARERLRKLRAEAARQ